MTAPPFVDETEKIGDVRLLPVNYIMENWVPGSKDQPWSWEDEERDILERECCCCGERGHYQLALEEHIAKESAIPASDKPWTLPLLGSDGRVWDGHHRLLAAKRLGIGHVFVDVVSTDG